METPTDPAPILTKERQAELQRLLDTLVIEIEDPEPGEIPGPRDAASTLERSTQGCRAQVRLREVATTLHPEAARDASPMGRKPTYKNIPQEPIYPTVILDVHYDVSHVLFTIPHVRPLIATYSVFRFWSTVTNIVQRYRNSDEPITPAHLHGAESFWIDRLLGKSEPALHWRQKNSVRAEHLRIDGPSEIFRIYASEPEFNK